MQTFKLIDLIDTPQKINCVYRRDYGMHYTYISLEPNKEYEFPDDEAFKQSILNSQFRKMYDPNMEKMLKAHNVPYKVESCKACGGRVKKLVYCPIEVVE